MSTINHEELLRKYMRHVRRCESIDYTDRLNDSLESDVVFTDEECRELVKISEAIE